MRFASSPATFAGWNACADGLKTERGLDARTFCSGWIATGDWPFVQSAAEIGGFVFCTVSIFADAADFDGACGVACGDAWDFALAIEAASECAFAFDNIVEALPYECSDLDFWRAAVYIWATLLAGCV